MKAEVYGEVKNEGVQVEYLINNAGFGGRGKFHERAWEKDHAMIMLIIGNELNMSPNYLSDLLKKETETSTSPKPLCMEKEIQANWLRKNHTSH